MLLGSNLQYLRKVNGSMTQEKLAEKMGVSRQTVSKWESGEAYPELPKIMSLCDIFHCNLDDLLRQDLSRRTSIYYPVEIRRLEGFRAALYTMISPNPEEDAALCMENWAHRSGLLKSPGEKPVSICWNFPYLSEEQKQRFHLRGFVLGYILPEGFEPGCSGPTIHRQEEADYAVITIREPFQEGRSRIAQGYHRIFEYLAASGLKKRAQSGVLPCFERIYERNGIVYADLHVHCEGTEVQQKTNPFR